MKLIYLEWEDAIGHSSWIYGEDALKKWIKESNSIIKHVGWLYQETSKYIILIGRIDDDVDIMGYGMTQKIPKTWIRKRIDLTKYVK